MRILVLGGTAFVSAALTRLALQRGHEVTCLARGSDQSPPDGVRFLRADREQGTVAYQAVTGDWDAVFDVARQPRYVREAVELLAPHAAHWTLVSSLSVYAHDDDPPGADESAELLRALADGVRATGETYGEGKVACEELARNALAGRLHVSRAGLIAGRGDPSDRVGYWPARFARSPGSPVLVPDALGANVQVIGVADLVRWLLAAAEHGLAGDFNACGHPLPLGDVLDRAAQVAGSTSPRVPVAAGWLVDHQVAYWSGRESLPLWLPVEFTGFGTRSNTAAVAAGLRLSPIEDLLAECLEYERERGLDRDRKAGLSASRETELLAAWGRQNSLPGG